MAVEVEGLNLNVTANSGNIKQLIADLQELDGVLKTMNKSRADKLALYGSALASFGSALKHIDIAKISALKDALASLKDVSGIRMSKELVTNVKGIGEAFNSLGNMKDLYKKVDAFTRIMEPVKQLGSLSGVKNFANGLSALQEVYPKLDIRGLYNKTNAIARIMEPISKLGSMSGVKNIGIGLENFRQQLEKTDMRKFYGQVQALNRTLTPLAKTLETMAESAKVLSGGLSIKETKTKKVTEEEPKPKKWEAFVTVLSKVYELFEKIGAKVRSATKNLLKFAAVKLAPIVNPFKNFSNIVKSVNDKLKNTFNSLKRIAFYRIIRTIIKEITAGLKEGIENLYQWSKITNGDFAPAMDKITTAMLYFKNSVAAAVSPLITYFAPVIDLCVDKIVALINVVNQFFARVTGRATWTAALKYPTEYAEKAAGAAKKVKDNLQSFDELHILTTPNDGGAGDALDYSKMFEERDFDEDVTSWIDDFKTAIQQGDWAGAGEILGNSINSMFSSVDWEKLGTDTAKRINNVFSFAYSTLKTMDFTAIGSDIATFLNKAIGSLNTELIGKTFARKWTAIIDFLYGFVSTFDFTTFGTKVSQFVEGWFKEIDGGRIGETVSKIIVGIFKAGIAFLSNEKMLKEFAKDISDFFNNLDVKGIISNAIKFIKTLAFAIGTVVVDIFKNVEWGKIFSEARDGIIEGLRSAVGVDDSDGTAVGRRDTQGVFVVGNQVIQKPDTHIGHGFSMTSQQTNTLPEHKKSIPWETIGWSTLGVNALADLVNVYRFSMNNVKDYSALGVALEKSATISKTSTKKIVSDAKSMNKNVTTTYENMGKEINDRLVETYSETGKTHDNIAKGVTSTAESVKASLSSAYTELGNKARYTGDNITSLFRSVTTTTASSLSSMKSSAISAYDSMAKGVKTPLDTLKTNTNTAMTAVKSGIVTKITEATSSVKSKFAGMNSSVQSTLDSCKTSWSNKFTEKDGINDTLESVANACADGVTTGFSNAKSGGVKAMADMASDLKAKEGPYNNIISYSETMANSVAKAFNKVIDSLNSIKATTPDWLPDKNLRNKTWSMSIDKIKTISIPGLATGGVVSSPTTALIGEAGREAVVPLDRNTGWMDEIAMRVSANNAEEVALLREQNMYLQEIASKEFGISERAIFNAVRNENRNFTMRTGKSLLAT